MTSLPNYYLVLWKEPRVRTGRAAERVFHQGGLSMGTRREQEELEAMLHVATDGNMEIDRSSVGLTVLLTDAALVQFGDRIRRVAAEAKYFLFDPQCGRLVEPSRSTSPWPPDWMEAVQTIRDVAEEVGPRDSPDELREALIAEVARRLPVRPAPQPEAELELPFERPPGFVLPALLPPRRRTQSRFERLAAGFTKRRPESRRAAAIMLAGWTYDPRAIHALRDRFEHDDDTMVRGLAAFGLALSAAVDLDELTAVARLYAPSQDFPGSKMSPETWLRTGAPDPDEEGLAYLLLAGAVVGRGGSVSVWNRLSVDAA